MRGNAASARPPITNSAEVKRIAFQKPLIRSMSWRLAIAEMNEPAAMKSSALKKAWVIRWKRPCA